MLLVANIIIILYLLHAKYGQIYVINHTWIYAKIGMQRAIRNYRGICYALVYGSDNVHSLRQNKH